MWQLVISNAVFKRAVCNTDYHTINTTILSLECNLFETAPSPSLENPSCLSIPLVHMVLPVAVLQTLSWGGSEPRDEGSFGWFLIGVKRL